MKLTINKSANEIMQQHAIELFPDECCGFLYGHETNEIRTIELADPVVNSKDGDKKRRFEISPLDYMKAEQYALQNNIGLYRCLSLASATSGDSFRARFETSYAVFFLRHFISDGRKNSRHQKLETQRRKHDFHRRRDTKYSIIQ
jgi:hypothetical protein